MQAKILQTTEQPLLSRKQVNMEFTFQGKSTPSNAEMKAEVAKATKAKEDQIVLKGLDTKFGSYTGNLTAYVYDSLEFKNKFELLTKHQKEQIKKAEEAKKKAEEEAKKAAEEAKKKAEEEKAAAQAAKAEGAEEKAEEKPAE